MSDVQGKSFGKFMILWAADFYANIASGLTAFALGIYMFEMTGTATSVALTVLFAFLPAMLLNPVAGVLADRFDRRLMMMIGDGCLYFVLYYDRSCQRMADISWRGNQLGVCRVA